MKRTEKSDHDVEDQIGKAQEEVGAHTNNPHMEAEGMAAQGRTEDPDDEQDATSD